MDIWSRPEWEAGHYVEQLSSENWRIAIPISRSNGELVDLFYLPMGDYDKPKHEMLRERGVVCFC